MSWLIAPVHWSGLRQFRSPPTDESFQPQTVSLGQSGLTEISVVKRLSIGMKRLKTLENTCKYWLMLACSIVPNSSVSMGSAIAIAPIPMSSPWSILTKLCVCCRRTRSHSS